MWSRYLSAMKFGPTAPYGYCLFVFGGLWALSMEMELVRMD